MLSKRFAGVNVGKVYFYEWNVDPQQCIPQGDAGVGERRRVDDDESGAVLGGGMNAFDQLVFAVALQAFAVMAGAFGLIDQVLVDLIQGLGAVNAWLTGAQQIQVRPIEYQQLCHDEESSFYVPSSGVFRIITSARSPFPVLCGTSYNCLQVICGSSQVQRS